jgi:hypothetical protein
MHWKNPVPHVSLIPFDSAHGKCLGCAGLPGQHLCSRHVNAVWLSIKGGLREQKIGAFASVLTAA